MTSNFRSIISLILVLLVLKTPARQVTVKAHIDKVRLPTGLYGSAGIYDGIDSIYLLGGNYIKNKKDVLRYSVSSSSISIVGQLPFASSGGTVQMVENGNIFYIAGGGGDYAFEYDPKMNKCTYLELDDTVEKNFLYGSSVLLNGSHILLLGAWPPEYCGSIWDFDTINSTFTEVGNSTQCFLFTVAVRKNNSHAFIFGEKADVIALNLETLESTVIPGIPQFLHRPTLTTDGKYAYALGDNVKQILRFDMNTPDYLFIRIKLGGLFNISKEDKLENPTSVYVKDNNRIYFFGGAARRFGDARYFDYIWYIALDEIEKNKDVGISATLVVICVSSAVIVCFLAALIIRISCFQLKRRTERTLLRNSTHKSNTVWESQQPIVPVSLEPIGSGSFATVYKARDLNQVHFAIKKISLYKAMLNMKTWDIEKVFREVEHLTQINHENVVQLYKWWIENPHGNILGDYSLENLRFHEWSSTQNYFLFLQMEFCDETLRDWLTFRDTLESRLDDDVKGIMLQIVKGLRAIHEKGIIHRDIKPNNIFHLKVGNVWKIGDLGLSIKFEDFARDLSVTGCRPYRSPEMSKSSEYGYKTDVFSLGLTFLEIIHVFENELVKYQAFEEIRNFDRGIDFLENDPIIKEELPELIFKMLLTDADERIDIFNESIDRILLQE